MATATEVVHRALSYNLNRQSEAAIEPDELQDGIAVLNDMMTQLESDNVYLGYTYITDGAQQVTVPPGVLLGLTQNLAVQLAPMFGGKVSPLLERNAEKSMRSLMTAGMKQPTMSYPRTLPRGSGTFWWNQPWNPFFEGKITPEVSMYFNANATVTTISTVSTPVLIAGTWAETKASHFTTTAAGLITYTGEETKLFNLQSRFTATVAGKHVIFWVYLNSVPVEPSQTAQYVESTATVPVYLSIVLKKNDTIQFYVENIDDTTDILIADAYAELQ